MTLQSIVLAIPRQPVIHAGILATLALVPVWYRLPGAPAPWTAHYVTGYAIFIPIVWTLSAWLLLGLPGLRDFAHDRLRLTWALSLIMLVIWALLSSQWAFSRAEVAVGAAVQMALAAAFAICVACAGPSPRTIIMALIGAALVHAAIGGLQVALQGTLGLPGELPLDPQQSGVSVVQSGDTRWLRPYGLASHPNVFAGFIVAGLLASAAWITAPSTRMRGTLAFFFLLWILLLTFSRGAWIGFAAGAVALLPLLLRDRLRDTTTRRYVVAVLGGAVAFGLVFFILYRPLLLTRTTGGELTEVQSVGKRAVLMEVAFTAVDSDPVRGVGAGNFPWYASHYLYYFSDLDLRGDNVHSVLLSAQAELGIVGLLLTVVMVVTGIESGLRRLDANRAVLISIVVALMVIGLVDHYPWTMVHYQILWWSLLA